MKPNNQSVNKKYINVLLIIITLALITPPLAYIIFLNKLQKNVLLKMANSLLNYIANYLVYYILCTDYITERMYVSCL